MGLIPFIILQKFFPLSFSYKFILKLLHTIYHLLEPQLVQTELKKCMFSFQPIGEIVTNLSTLLNWLKVEFYVLKFIYLHVC